jgi:hypothetical protein
LKRFTRLLCIGILSVFYNHSLESKALEEIPIDWTSYSEDQIKLYLQEQEKLKESTRIKNLNLAKASLINGNVKRANFFLGRIQELENQEDDQLILIKKRYQALISFIENDPRKSLSFLKNSNFDRPSLYPYTCLLKIINMTNFPMDPALRRELIRCQRETQRFSKNEQFWLENILILKNNDTAEMRGTILSTIDFILSSPDVLRIWLKSGLFFNQEGLILNHLETLTQTVYRSPQAREIIALLYYRQNEYDMARKFIEDIESPNADNIRGNLSLDQKKYELAFGHYKLALQKKQNSLNALERSLPLAWILGQWDDGVDLLDSLIKPELDPKNKQALRVAFIYQSGDFQAAKEELSYLERLFNFKGPVEVNQLKNAIALQTKDKKASVESSTRACQRHDGLNCWISLQEMTWPHLGIKMTGDEQIISSTNFKLDELKAPSSTEPIQETPIIDQKDIEEMDGEQVQLVPGEFY